MKINRLIKKGNNKQDGFYKVFKIYKYTYLL